MHICHLTVGHYPYDDRIYYKELWALRDWADEITLVAPSIRKEAELVYPEIRVLTYQPTSIYRNVKQTYSMALDVDADLYHLHEAELLSIVPFLRRNTDAAIIYDMHEPLPEVIRDFSPASFPKRMLVATALGVLEQAGLSGVDGTIFTSKALAIQKRWATRRHTIIYNYPRLDIFSPGVHHDTTDFTVLYQGQIAPARGITDLIEGFAQFYRDTHDGTLRIIGNIDPPEFEATLRAVITQHNLTSVVSIDDPVPHSEMPKILAEASVGIMALLPTPAFKKSVQGKTFEYLASGLPAIAGNYASAYQFIGETDSGIVLTETTPHTIAKALHKLYSKPKLRKKMSKNGVTAVTEHFNWEIMQEELRRFYSEILSARSKKIIHSIQ